MAQCRNRSSVSPMARKPKKFGNLVYEFIEAGYGAKITIIKTDERPKYFLGQTLTKGIASEVEETGVDICEENGDIIPLYLIALFLIVPYQSHLEKLSLEIIVVFYQLY